MPAPDHSRICIVSGELNRLFRNGGVGTACTGLAQLLASDGHRVTVLYTGELPDLDRARFDELAAGYATEMGVEVVPLERPAALAATRGRFAARSLAIYRQLAAREWDAVFFNDVGGEGFYSVIARQAGLAFPRTALCLVTHGPRTWVRELNEWPLANADELENVFMERETARLADHVISPSRYMLDWLAADGWTFTGPTRVTKCRLPQWPDAVPDAPVPRTAIRELVFFGRLEHRKGVSLFCDAVDELATTERELRITFLGKFGDILGEHGGGHVLRRARHWPFSLRFLPRLDQAEALAYLRSSPAALPVIPSLVDNLPCVVHECLREGIPFVATDTGGIPELVADEDRSRCLCAAEPGALAASVRSFLRTPPAAGRAAESADEIDAAWRTTLADVLATRARIDGGRTGSTAPVTVVVVTRADAVAPETLQSLAAQRDATVDVRAITGATELAGARRAAIREASTDHVLLLDDGAVLAPGAVATLLASGQALDADVCTCLSLVPDPDSDALAPDLPLGGDRQSGFCRNVFGDGVALVRRKPVTDAGLLETTTFGSGSWASLCEASFAGLKLRCIPEPLVRAAPPGPEAIETHAPVRRIFERHEFRDCPLLHDLLVGHVRPVDRQPHHGLLMDDPQSTLLRALSRVPPQSDDALRLMATHAARTGRPETALELRALLAGPGGDPSQTELAVVLATRDLESARLAPECADAQGDHAFDLVRVDGEGPALQVHPVIGREIRCQLPLGNPRGLTRVEASVFLASPRAPPTEFHVEIRGERGVVVGSDWTRVEEPGVAVALTLQVPVLSAGLYDLALSTRLPGPRMSHAHARFRDIRLIFEDVAAAATGSDAHEP